VRERTLREGTPELDMERVRRQSKSSWRRRRKEGRLEEESKIEGFRFVGPFRLMRS